MDTLIGTVGYFDSSQGRGIIHPDFNHQSHGIDVRVTPEGLQQSGMESLSSGLRVTCTVSQGEARDIKEYEGQGIAG